MINRINNFCFTERNTTTFRLICRIRIQNFKNTRPRNCWNGAIHNKHYENGWISELKFAIKVPSRTGFSGSRYPRSITVEAFFAYFETFQQQSFHFLRHTKICVTVSNKRYKSLFFSWLFFLSIYYSIKPYSHDYWRRRQWR